MKQTLAERAKEINMLQEDKRQLLVKNNEILAQLKKEKYEVSLRITYI